MSKRHKTAVIVSAKRTAIGSLGGALSTVSAHTLGATVIRDVCEIAGVSQNEVSEAIMGQVLTAGAGQNPARQAAIAAGLAPESTALTINQVCGSGLRAVAMAAQSIALGEDTISVAGGQESMSLSPHVLGMRTGVKFGDVKALDTLIKDGLWDAFHGYHMGVTAENVAEAYSITREEQDRFAVQSQNRTEQAIASGVFKEEITPVIIKTRKAEVIFDTDEFPRTGVTAKALSALRPAFKKDGTVTAGNASGINDGAAAVLVMSEDEAEKRGLPPLARIVSFATRGVEPALMGTGPIPASRAALERAGWAVTDLDRVESNEAFAAQACAVRQALDLDPGKVNVSGGAIALGHPIGASGARILVTLLHGLKANKEKKGLATLCIGGGMGIAMCVEAL